MFGLENISLEFSRAEAEEAKVAIAQNIKEIIQDNEIKQVDASKAMGIDPTKVGRILRGRTSRFTLDDMCSYLDKLKKWVADV